MRRCGALDHETDRLPSPLPRVSDTINERRTEQRAGAIGRVEVVVIVCGGDETVRAARARRTTPALTVSDVRVDRRGSDGLHASKLPKSNNDLHKKRAD
jgi:hypothetical protein